MAKIVKSEFLGPEHPIFGGEHPKNYRILT